MRAKRRVAPTDEELAWAIAVRARTGPHASKQLAELFRGRRDLDAQRRRIIAETAYGLLRRGRALEVLAEGARDRTRTILETLAALEDPSRRDGVLARLASLDDVTRVGVFGSLPNWLAARLIADFGVPEAEALARALSERPETDLRANPTRVDREGLIAALAAEGIRATPLATTRFGVRLAHEARDLYATTAFREGAFEVQDEGSQRVAELVAAKPGMTVIDACAGEGGKTLAMAATMGGRGRIVACDVSAKKLEVLRRRAKRAGVQNVQTLEIAREGPLPRDLPRADVVLVDAPCSGVGTLRRNPELRFHLDERAPTRLAAEQRAIATRFAPLAPRLVYATCTVLEEEDEASVAAIVAATGFVAAPPLRLFPHVDGTDGFFAAVLVQPGGV